MRAALGSLRWRLTLTYVGLLAVLLAGLGIFEYAALQHSLVSTRVSDLRGDLQEAVTDLGANRVPARARAAGAAVPPSVADVQRVINGVACATIPAAVRRNVATFLANRTSLISGRSVSVAIYDPSLTVIAHVPAALASLPRLSSAALDRALGGSPSAADVIDDGNGAPQLVVAFPVRPKIAQARATSPCIVAQLATPTAPIDDVLASDRDGLLAGGGAVLLLALLAGLWLTGRTLRPLHRVADTAGRLAGGDLRARSGLAGGSDEVATLGRAFDDMADRIEAAFAAQAESEARTRRFIADASHELRTPVTALKGYIDVLRRGVAREPEALEAALAAMGRESDRMRALVLDLLTLARIDAHPTLALQPLDLNEVLSSVLDDGVPGMPEAVERRFAGAPVMAVADRGSVATIARNLLVNACKYAPGSRQVWSTSVDDGRAFFSVRDEGPGIPAADLPHLFERFYRGEKTRAREEGGTGLGLSIVQGLVRAQGGQVSIASEESLGTEVTVHLPLATTH